MKVDTRTLELQTKNLQLLQEVKEREQAEIELKKAKEEAEAATEMKSTFLATMSHGKNVINLRFLLNVKE